LLNAAFAMVAYIEYVCSCVAPDTATESPSLLKSKHLALRLKIEIQRFVIAEEFHFIPPPNKAAGSLTRLIQPVLALQ
jgi:hypothetical protein